MAQSNILRNEDAMLQCEKGKREPHGYPVIVPRRPQGALKAPSRRPQCAIKDPWRYVEHRAAAVQAPYISLAMLNFPGRPSHGDCESHPFRYQYKYRDSCLAYHNLIV